MNTKKKGDRGIGRAICAFTAHDWTVCLPVTDSQDYDLVVDIPAIGLQRVQVKYIAREVRPGCFQAQLGIRGGTRGGVWKKPADMNFDWLFIAAADGSDWMIPRCHVRSAIDVGRESKNKDFEFRVVK